MQRCRILYVITTPEDKILHHILWNQQQHPSALFAIVAMNPTVDKWLQEHRVECSLIHGDLPYSPGRLEEFYSVMQGPIFRDLGIPSDCPPFDSPPGTGGEVGFSFAENIPIDRLLQFFEFESREQERKVLNDVDFDELICSFDMDHPVIHSLLRKCNKLRIPTTVIQCTEIRAREMLDIPLPFDRFVVDLDEDHDFMAREMGIKSEQIEVVGKTLYSAFDDMKQGLRSTSAKIANQLELADNDRGIFLHYLRRHNWEIRRFLRIFGQLNESDPWRIVLFVYCDNDTDTHEFLTLFNDDLNHVNWRLAPNDSDVTILNHCFPVWLAFRWNRDLEIASRLGQNVLIYDPFDYNCSKRLGVDDMAWKVIRDDTVLIECLNSLNLSHSERSEESHRGTPE